MKAPKVRARLDTCPRCSAAIIVALDAAVAGLPVHADPLPLDGPAELQARLEGRTTYNVVGHARVGQALVERIPELIKHRRHPVVATHRCPGPVPATAIPPPRQTGPAEPNLFTPEDEPPY
ncbi:hypothetical protein AB0I72_00590 [Nocardiopsis sp. NPDC049922]|uniref:hypothetical protein n=1 Tax=Nocardiopsis sp. NPDC049922 TaxID=3155157 RepID=UPI00340A98DF